MKVFSRGADKYLSGNVREKLRVAKAAALENTAFGLNVEALLEVNGTIPVFRYTLIK